MSKTTKLTPLPSDKKASKTKKVKKEHPYFERFINFLNKQVYPYFAFLVMIGLSAYAVLDLVGKFGTIDERLQGALALLVISLLVGPAFKKFSSKK